MNKFFLITKINLLSFFNLQRVNNSKYKSVNKKNYFRILLFVFVFLYLGYYAYFISYNLMPGLISINKPHLLFGIIFMIVNMFIIFSNIFKIKSVLFDFKDYDLLFSLPIKRNTILLSKLFSLYLLNLLYTVIFMIPAFVAYIKFLSFDNTLIYFLLIFIVPIVPLVISIIIGIMLSFFTSKFINKTIGGYIMYILIIAIAFYVSFKLDGMTSVDMANMSSNSIDKVGGYYPFVDIFLRIITNFNWPDLLIFIIAPLVLMVIMSVILDTSYDKIRAGLIRNKVSDNYQIREYRGNIPLVSLYKKEMKKFLSNPMYPLNTIIGCIMLIFIIIGLLVFDDSTIAKLFSINELSAFLQKYVVLMICLFCVLSSTTHCSLSLEGKSFWIVKMIPVKIRVILFSKILVNLTILVATVIISATFFGIYLHLAFIDFLILYLMPLAYSFFISQMGLLFNIMDPKFDYANEVQVIKQSLPVFLTLIVGLISVIIPLSIHELNTAYCILVTGIIFIIDIILCIVINTYGVKKINRMGG